jgi:hypothetical protein
MGRQYFLFDSPATNRLPGPISSSGRCTVYEELQRVLPSSKHVVRQGSCMQHVRV